MSEDCLKKVRQLKSQLKEMTRLSQAVVDAESIALSANRRLGQEGEKIRALAIVKLDDYLRAEHGEGK